MTVDQIRTALDQMEANYSLAIDADELTLARAFYDKIMFLRSELVRTICAEDPCTSEADVRYFEGWHD
jgi:hypothetical protein